MSDCMDCIWWTAVDRQCLLGRDPSRCDSNPARRGDIELVDRILNLPEDQREALNRRFIGERSGAGREEAGEGGEDAGEAAGEG